MSAGSHASILRAALVGLVGASTKEELEGMASTLRPFSRDPEVGAALAGVQALLATMETEKQESQPESPLHVYHVAITSCLDGMAGSHIWGGIVTSLWGPTAEPLHGSLLNLIGPEMKPLRPPEKLVITSLTYLGERQQSPEVKR